MATIKENKLLKQREKKEAREELDMMKTFVRLMDYIHITSVSKALEGNNRNFLEHVMLPNTEQRAPIEITLEFRRHTLIPIFTPDEDDVTTTISIGTITLIVPSLLLIIFSPMIHLLLSSCNLSSHLITYFLLYEISSLLL